MTTEKKTNRPSKRLTLKIGKGKEATYLTLGVFWVYEDNGMTFQFSRDLTKEQLIEAYEATQSNPDARIRVYDVQAAAKAPF